MDVRRIARCAAIMLGLTGCAVSSGSKQCETENDSINVGPLIGLFGMAVDGDDKDDYKHFFKADCKCGRCSKCRH